MRMLHSNEEYECSVAERGADYINLYDESGDLLHSFVGVSDFDAFTVEGGEFSEPRESVETRVTRVLLRAAAPSMGDEDALSVVEAWPDWRADASYQANEIVRHGDGLYRVVQAHTSQGHQVPGGDGMLAVYRPIAPQSAGTQADPIPFVNGMDVDTGLYYSFSGRVWLAKADMKPCVWNPGTAGLWQWQEVS